MKLNHSLFLILLFAPSTFLFAQIKIGDSLASLGFYEKALDFYENDARFLKHYKKAKVLESLGDMSAAQSEYEQYLAIDSLSLQVRFDYGKNLFLQDQFFKAIAVFEPLAKNNENATFYYYLGQAYHEVFQTISAVKAYENVIRLRPLHIPSNYFLTKQYLFENKLTKAKYLIDSVLEKYPENTAFIYLNAKYFIAISEYDQAIEQLNLYIQLNQKDDFVYETLAKTYMNNREYQKAIETLQQAIKTFNAYENANYQYYLGVSYGYLKEVENAKKHILNSVDILTIKFAREYYSIGYFYYENKQYPLAIQYFKKAINEQDDYEDAHYHWLLIRLESNEKASEKLKAVEDFNSKFPGMNPERKEYIQKQINYWKKEAFFEK
jgi:tetratricopeptide (TPR) repeat protein